MVEVEISEPLYHSWKVGIYDFLNDDEACTLLLFSLDYKDFILLSVGRCERTASHPIICNFICRNDLLIDHQVELWLIPGNPISQFL